MYYPELLSATITKTHPWVCPTANIKLAVMGAGFQYTSVPTARGNDIIRLQVMEPGGVWKELFSGRIKEIAGRTGATSIEYDITAYGHGLELVNRLIRNNYNFVNVDTGTIIKTVLPELTTIADRAGATYINYEGTVLQNYNVKADATYFKDVLNFMEKAELLQYKFDVIPYYDETNTLKNLYASWQPIPTEPTEKYRVAEGSRDYVTSDFITSLTDMVHSVTVYGAEGTVQRSAFIGGGVGDRDILETDTSIETNEMCRELARALFLLGQEPEVTGNATLYLKPAAEPGDLVQVNVPSQIVNGRRVMDNIRVNRVQHVIEKDNAHTVLQLGNYRPGHAEIIAYLVNLAGTIRHNFVQ
jgi:hypothetical protein